MSNMAASSTAVDIEALEHYRPELTGFAYRMLASVAEADDAVQETFVRAWRAAGTFEGRSSVRSWLYRIATNVCLDMLRGRQRRARPMDLGPSSPPEARFLGAMEPEHAWVTPIPDGRVFSSDRDPSEIAEERETIRLAFVTALQHLPARQRAVLILREVLHWRAAEVAELLDMTVPAVNSALQRARAALASANLETRVDAVHPDHAELLARYVDAFERYDIETLVTLLHEDAVQSMPPYPIWLRGADSIGRWMLGPGIGCKGSRLLPTRANGRPAFGQYRVDPNGGHRPWALHVLEIVDGKIAEFHAFLDTERLFPAFGLPDRLPS
ncbi:MAG TPA: sigma-70 family RNA polymerase sigma factor [Acidimicrobiia bacterium]|nr:sigma-70 family RNA polymerase sigma factor [Acidimicrobiia bacterium]